MNKNNPALFFLVLLLLPLPLVLFLSAFAVTSALDQGVSLSAQQTRAVQSTESAHQQQQRGTAIAQQVEEAYEATRNAPVSFSEDVLPILQARCVFCHGPNSVAGAPPNGLELNTYENVMRGSNFLPVVQPGQPENSSLILLLRSGGMPASADPETPAEPLPEEQINLIARWIEQGAKDN